MSDTNIQLLAFVSDNGYVIGIGKPQADSLDPDTGMAVAILRNQVTLIEWLSTLNESSDLLDAVHTMITKHGGQPIAEMINMNNATFIPLMGTAVAEA